MDWQHYWQQEPFACEAFQLATLLALTYNINRKKGARRAKPDDFLPGKRKSKRTGKSLMREWNAEVEGIQRAMRENDRTRRGRK